MKKLISLVALFFAGSVFASSELVQVVSFDWVPKEKKLKFVSLGSGTAIDSNLILTNAHVVQEDGKTAEFVLLCPAQPNAGRSVQCTTTATVVAVHPEFDAALIRPLSPDVFLPSVRPIVEFPRIGSAIRVEGFPVSLGDASGMGNSKTFELIRDWESKGGILMAKGDAPTISMGEVEKIAELQKTGEIYYITNVPVNFGDSGGAAFDESGNFIGMATLRDKEKNALILSYGQLKDWINENKNQYPYISPDVIGFYTAHVRGNSENQASLIKNLTTSLVKVENAVTEAPKTESVTRIRNNEGWSSFIKKLQQGVERVFSSKKFKSNSSAKIKK